MEVNSESGSSIKVVEQAAAAAATKAVVVQNLKCPLTLEVSADPVVAEDGRIYERSVVEQHILACAAGRRGHTLRSPMTNQPMGPRLLPVPQIKCLIEELGLSKPNLPAKKQREPRKQPKERAKRAKEKARKRKQMHDDDSDGKKKSKVAKKDERQKPMKFYYFKGNEILMKAGIRGIIIGFGYAKEIPKRLHSTTQFEPMLCSENDARPRNLW